MQISSDMNLKEHTQGIQDDYGKQEIKVNRLGKQIFNIYDNSPIKLHNNNEQVFRKEMLDGTDHGIDDVIFIDDIPEDDPLRLKQLEKGRHTDVLYTIDYKSNNFKIDMNSVYVKLMP